VVQDSRSCRSSCCRNQCQTTRHSYTADGEIDLPAPVRRAIEQVLTELAAGNAVHVLGDEHDMTTQEVAELLGLSRTFVVRLIDDGNWRLTSPAPTDEYEQPTRLPTNANAKSVSQASKPLPRPTLPQASPPTNPEQLG
jgi:hypothetical protein